MKFVELLDGIETHWTVKEKVKYLYNGICKNIIYDERFMYSQNKELLNSIYNREVKYYLDKDVSIIADKNSKDIKYNIEKEFYDVKAPLKKNDKIGKLILTYDGNTYEYDLIVKEDVKKASFMKVFSNLLSDIISGVKLK